MTPEETSTPQLEQIIAEYVKKRNALLQAQATFDAAQKAKGEATKAHDEIAHNLIAELTIGEYYDIGEGYLTRIDNQIRLIPKEQMQIKTIKLPKNGRA